MAGLARYRIVLAKEDFKFSVAHFTLFADGRAELLHGHNYRVRVELGGTRLDACGLLADLERCKRAVRALCAGLDSRTLLPALGDRLRVERTGETVEARLGDERCYSFPAADTVLLPLANTSIELLAQMIWHDFVPELAGSLVETLGISVEESAGQRCWYEDQVPATPVTPATPATPAGGAAPPAP